LLELGHRFVATLGSGRCVVESVMSS